MPQDVFDVVASIVDPMGGEGLNLLSTKRPKKLGFETVDPQTARMMAEEGIIYLQVIGGEHIRQGDFGRGNEIEKRYNESQIKELIDQISKFIS